MVVPVIVGEHGHAGLADPGLVEGGQLRAAACGGGRDGQLGGAHDGAAVGPEAYGVILRGAGEQLPVGHQDAQGVAGGGVVEVAVDRPHHPVAQALVVPGRLGGGEPGADRAAVGGHGDHLPGAGAVGQGGQAEGSVGEQPAGDVLIRRRSGFAGGVGAHRDRRGEGRQVRKTAGRGVGEVVLVAGLVVAVAPEDVLAVDHAVPDGGAAQPHLLTVGLGVGQGCGGGQEGEDQDQG